MPKSKVHHKRKMTLKKRKAKFESLIRKRVKAFNALPEQDQVSLLAHWEQLSTKALKSGATKQPTIEQETDDAVSG